MGTYGQFGTGSHAEIDEISRPFWSGGADGVGVYITHTDCKLVKFNRHYSIIRYDGVPVGISLDLISRDPANDQWYYKPLDDSMGPCELDCPLSLIDIADSGRPAQGYAIEWRQKVRDYWAGQRATNTRGLKVGDIITLKDGLTIKGEGRVFEIRRNTPQVYIDGTRYRINRKHIAAFRRPEVT